jgi:A/G-specific adenine glycosylase
MPTFARRRIAPAKIRLFRRKLFAWGAKNLRQFPWRKSNASHFHQVLAEVLLQRTRAETVAAFWPAFLSRFPSWARLASAKKEEISTALKPIGLASQRAPRLQALARIMSSRRGRFPESREEIQALPGVGQYIANAIELFATAKPRPLIDVNMARVLERYFGPRRLVDVRYDPYLQQLAHEVVSGDRPRKLNWAILDFAAMVCTLRNPRCTTCILARDCRYRAMSKNLKAAKQTSCAPGVDIASDL